MSDTDRMRYAALCQALMYVRLFGRRLSEARSSEAALVAAVALRTHLDLIAWLFEGGEGRL